MEKKEKFASDTSGRSAADWAKALVLLLIGLTVAHLGVTLFLLSELGTDTFTVFIQGLFRIFGLTVGTVHVIVLCVLMVVMLLTTKGYVKPGTVVRAFCGGPIIDLFSWMLGGYINAEEGMAVRIVSMVLGCVILSAGMSLVINSNAGTVAAVFLTGPLVQFWLPKTKKIVRAVLREE